MPESRKPEVTFGDDIERRPVAARLHHQRAGPAPARHGADRPLRRPGRPGRRAVCARRSTPRSPSATTRCACCGPPASRPASRSSPTRRWSPPCERMHGRLSIVSAERIRDELDKIVMRRRALGGAVVRGAHGPGRRVPPRAARAWRSNRIRSTATRTCWRTRWRWSTRRRRTGCCAWPRSSTTSASRSTRAITDGGVSFHHHEVVGARMTRARMEALRYPAADIDTVVRLVELHLRFHTYRLGLDRQGRAPLRARRRPAPRPAQRADPLRLHDPERGQGPGAGPADGRAGGAASPSCASRRSSMPCGPI